jgi:hypothetical protein
MTVLAVLAGIGLGIALKWLADVVMARLQHRREDQVWRRERCVGAAADLLDVCWELAEANDAVTRAAVGLDHAGRTDPEDVPRASELLALAKAEHRPLPPRANRALEVLRLYAPSPVVVLGEELWDLAMEETPDVGTVMREHTAAVQECADRFVTEVRKAVGVSGD